MAVASHDHANVYDIGRNNTPGGSLEDPVFLYHITEPGVCNVAGDPLCNGNWHSAAFTWDGEVIIMGWEPGGGLQAECEASDPRGEEELLLLRRGRRQQARPVDVAAGAGRAGELHPAQLQPGAAPERQGHPGQRQLPGGNLGGRPDRPGKREDCGVERSARGSTAAAGAGRLRPSSAQPVADVRSPEPGRATGTTASSTRATSARA